MIHSLHTLMALGKAAKMLRRPDVAAVINEAVRMFVPPDDDHDFAGAPRTREWIARHGQPGFSKHADYINDLTAWACELERELARKK